MRKKKKKSVLRSRKTTEVNLWPLDTQHKFNIHKQVTHTHTHTHKFFCATSLHWDPEHAQAVPNTTIFHDTFTPDSPQDLETLPVSSGSALEQPINQSIKSNQSFTGVRPSSPAGICKDEVGNQHAQHCTLGPLTAQQPGSF